MKLETFFEKFDELADTPNGVTQLRELVMQLAVEGGLVPHSAAETAVPYASVEDASPINVSDVPENWRVVLLADAIMNRSGNSKLIKGKLHEEPAVGRFQGFSASGADVWCDDYEHEGQAIIISAVGARCGKAFKASGKWCAIANTSIARPEPTLFDFDFAYLVLNNEHFWVRGGSAQPFVKFPPSLDRYFALPPLAEQKRIVTKVHELMALCDRLEAQQQERETRHAALARASLAHFADAPTPANLHFLFHPSYTIPPADIRKSILSLAVRGGLVNHSPDEPAIPYESIEDATPINIDEVPSNWRVVHLADAIKNRSGNSKLIKGKLHEEPAPGRFQGFSASGADVWCDNYEHEGQAIIISAVGARCGKAFKAFGKWSAIANTNIARPEPTLFDFDFAYLILNNENFWVRGGSAQPFVKFPPSLDRYFALPPIAEQRRIVAKVEQLMALVDALEQQLAASRATAAKLLTAFVAELTAQD